MDTRLHQGVRMEPAKSRHIGESLNRSLSSLYQIDDKVVTSRPEQILKELQNLLEKGYYGL